MRQSFVFISACALVACAGREPQSPASLPDVAEARSLAAYSPGSMGTDVAQARAEIATAQLESAPRPASSGLFSFMSGSSASSTPASQLPDAGTTEQGAMIDIEARYGIQCDAVTACAAKFRELVPKYGGRITVDEGTAGKETEVTFEVRIPAEKFEPFANGIVGLGAMSARDVRRRDVSKEYHDSELLLRERRATRDRFEELLKEAKDVPQTLQVEQQLERLRTEIDRIEGDMRWLKDRVAEATVRVKFSASASSEDAVFAPTATLYPTLRSTLMFDLRSENQRIGYAGGGFSVQFKPFARAITLDFDVARAALADKPTSSDWSYDFLLGLDLYSDLLGGGRRKLLNPYLGFRVGYAITEGSGDFAFGGVLGVDIVKTKAILFDISARVLGMAGNDQGAHVQIGPMAQFSVAF